jgi:hypothetical protein
MFELFIRYDYTLVLSCIMVARQKYVSSGLNYGTTSLLKSLCLSMYIQEEFVTGNFICRIFSMKKVWNMRVLFYGM